MKPTFGLYDIAIAKNANAFSNLGDVSTNIPSMLTRVMRREGF